MLRKEHDGIVWLEFEHLSHFPRVKHGVFLRHGGYSTGNFNSLNLSYNVGDFARIVQNNEKKVCQILGVKDILRGNLNHGKVVMTSEDPNRFNQPCDGLTTKTQGIGLLITHADCQAAIFYDPVNHASANVHAGWRGSVLNIYEETIKFMEEKYGSKAKDLLVGISPSLGPRDAEFIHYRTELPEHFWEFQVESNYFDFWEISKAQLMEAGVKKENIEIAAISTYSNANDYFSYRRDRKSGRHGTVIALL